MRIETDARSVAWITLARPERKNAFDAQVISELIAAVADIAVASTEATFGFTYHCLSGVASGANARWRSLGRSRRGARAFDWVRFAG